MRSFAIFFVFLVMATIAFGCASSIVEGEKLSLSSETYPPKSSNAKIELILEKDPVDRPYIQIGKVMSRAWVLEKGMEELKKQGRKLGADAVKDVKYERKFSVDYLQDLYFIEGRAVIWK